MKCHFNEIKVHNWTACFIYAIYILTYYEEIRPGLMENENKHEILITHFSDACYTLRILFIEK